MAPISADDDDRRGDSGGGDHFQVVHNFNKDPEVIRFLEPFKIIARALGVSDRIDDMSFDLGLVFEEETYNPLFYPQAGTYHNAEIWGVPVQIDIFNVMDFRPHFERIRRTTDDPDVLTFYQEIEETQVSFYQFDCWVRTFDGQEFFLSATSIVPDQKEVPFCLAVIDPNEKDAPCKITFPNHAKPKSDEVPPNIDGVPANQMEYNEYISNSDLATSFVDNLFGECGASMCVRCPNGAFFCPACILQNAPNTPIGIGLNQARAQYHACMAAADVDFGICALGYGAALALVLRVCFGLKLHEFDLKKLRVPKFLAGLIACLLATGFLGWQLYNCYKKWHAQKELCFANFMASYNQLFTQFCEEQENNP